MTKPIFVMFDLDDTLVNYSRAKEEALKYNPEQKFPQSAYGFYQDLQPMPYACAVIRELLDTKGIYPAICTAPSVLNPMSYTEKRFNVEKLFGMEMCHRLYIMPDKSRAMADVLVDNCTEGRGQERFEGELIHMGSDQFPNLRIIKNYLIEKVVSKKSL